MNAAPQIGSILLGKYRVERVLGQGGMGFVVAARHEQLGELFAIKMMLPDALRYQDARERFMREARAVARMKGEHVARVHDVGTLENGAPFMVMEHLTGEDLQGVLDKRGALPVGEAALYVYQACEAVAEAHALGIVHRDLKPANMFLTRRPNDTPCVKVIDFGISKDLDPNKVGPKLTKTGMIIGTPVYMAPEQMANNKLMDARSDIWSLGIILYELTTGRVPFLAESMTELVTQVLTTVPVPPSQAHPAVPPAFDAVVMRCLEKRPDLRFPSVRDLMAALHPFLGASLSATRASIPTPSPSRPGFADVTTVEQPQPVMTLSQPMTQAIPHAPTVHAPLYAQAVPPTRAQAYSVPSVEPRQTNGAWGGTNRTDSDKRGKTGLVVGLAMGAIIGLGLAGWVITRPAASDNTIVVKPAATSAESAATPERVTPVVPALPVGSAAQIVEESVAKPPESAAKPQQKVRVVPSALLPITPKVGEIKPPVPKPPISKVPDF